jgi:aldose 1-epimerase
MPDGTPVKIFTLTNDRGFQARVMEYGAILVSLEAPDRDGKLADVTFGYDKFEDWLKNRSYFGATVGRFGNRIAGGKFTLDGKEYTLATNSKSGGVPVHLHGGKIGFDKVLWKGAVVGDAVEFTYLSTDGEEGYPGNLEVKVSYRISADNQLTWSVTATTDAPTVVNMVQHAYFNLSGDPQSEVTDHEMTIHAEHYLPTDKGLIPTGELAPVAGTPMDFRVPQPIGKLLNEAFEALKLAGTYDHAWVFPRKEGMKLGAEVYDSVSGRKMQVLTDAPAVHFYLANFPGTGMPSKKGVVYRGRTALCLEAESFPDAPNRPEFPSTVLRPGELYQRTVVFRFPISEK